MRVLIKNKGFKYFNPITKKEDYSNKDVPFILDWDFKLINDINEYLLVKTLFYWNTESNTPKSNAERLLDFLDYADDLNKKWYQMDFSDIHNWINNLISNNQKKATINAKLTAVKGLFDWHCSNGNIKENPFNLLNSKEIDLRFNSFQKLSKKNISTINHPKLKTKDNFEEDIPTKKELKIFMNALNKEDKLMASILISTGMRKDELLQLNIDMINSMSEIADGDFYKLFLDASKMKIKYNKSRSVIINKTLRMKIIKHINSNQKKIIKYKKNNPNKDIPVFISNRGNKFSTDKLNKSFKKASKISGYFKSHNKDIYPHLLRHCFASYYIAQQIKEGNNVENVYLYISERLGHSNVEVTKEYYVKIVNKMQQHKDLVKFSEEFMEDFFNESR